VRRPYIPPRIGALPRYLGCLGGEGDGSRIFTSPSASFCGSSFSFPLSSRGSSRGNMGIGCSGDPGLMGTGEWLPILFVGLGISAAAV